MVDDTEPEWPEVAAQRTAALTEAPRSDTDDSIVLPVILLGLVFVTFGPWFADDVTTRLRARQSGNDDEG